MRKKLVHLYDIGSTFSMICEGKGVSGEMMNVLRSTKRKEVTCKKCLNKLNK